MAKHQMNLLGIQIKTKLMQIGQTQTWLIQQCRKITGMYVDCSNLYKIMTGQLNSPKLEHAIKTILQL